MDIESHGFRLVHENQVYLRNGQFQDRKTEETILLSRYTIPTEEDIVLYLQALARNRVQAPVLVAPGGARIDRISTDSPLEAVMRKLPDEIIQEIAGGNGDCITFIKKNTRAVRLNEGERPDSYIDVYYGIIPSEIIASDGKSEIERDYMWFRSMIENPSLLEMGMGNVFNFEMRYSFGGIAINRKDLEALLVHRTSRSRSFKFFGDYSHPAVREVVDLVYNDYKSAVNVASLNDHSQRMLDIAAFDSVKALYMLVAENVLKAQETKPKKASPKLRVN